MPKDQLYIVTWRADGFINDFSYVVAAPDSVMAEHIAHAHAERVTGVFVRIVHSRTLKVGTRVITADRDDQKMIRTLEWA
jgi:hypothetical protein